MKSGTYRQFPESKVFFSAEGDRNTPTTCPVDPISNQKYDSRYKQIGYEIDELSLFSNNGIISRISKSIPVKARQIFLARKTTKLYPQVRKTIPWKLTCEIGVNTREKVFKAIQDRLKKGETRNTES